MSTSPEEFQYARLEGRIEASAGALVPVEIRVTQHEAEQFHAGIKEVPFPRRGMGLIDSAADISCVKTEVVEYLRVPQIGTQLVTTAAASVNRGVYPTTVTLGWNSENPPDAIDLQVIAMGIRGVDMLVGRDVLSHGELVWYGPDGRFELVLPRSGAQFR